MLWWTSRPQSRLFMWLTGRGHDPETSLPHADVMSTQPLRRRIALVAHDNKKVDLLQWADFNRTTLRQHELYATGTTGSPSGTGTSSASPGRPGSTQPGQSTSPSASNMNTGTSFNVTSVRMLSASCPQ